MFIGLVRRAGEQPIAICGSENGVEDEFLLIAFSISNAARP